MLDLETLLLVQFSTTTLQAIAWLLIWLSWRQLYELKVIAAGFTAIALGVLLLLERGTTPMPFHIVFDNMTVKFGLVLLAEGMARFLGRPGCVRFGLACLAVFGLAFSAALTWAPADLGLRIHLSTLFTTVVMGMMIRTLLGERNQPRFVRWMTIGMLGFYITTSVVQSAVVYIRPATVSNGPILSDVNGWYFLMGLFFMNGFFICLLIMVCMRLFMDLRSRNTALAEEISERRRLERELSTSLEAEKVAREDQRQLTRMVSHEFRTPLAAIRYASEILGEVLTDPPEAVSRRLDSIGDSVSRMTLLIDRFLATERLTEGLVELEDLDMPAMSTEVQKHFDRVGKGHRLHFTMVEDVPDYRADAEMLSTVLVNLVDNALKYSSGETQVEIAVFTRSNLLNIRVSDRGVGIPPRELDNIGRRFFRASNVRGTRGNGLGLHTCFQLVEYHCGTLTIASRPGGGTIASVRLPVADRETQSVARTPQIQKAGT
ncbi:sensor histidine kinase [Salipiger mucosus]|nr:HAMP domain-containing sensor histidine kinase [Salipiger mucosus]